jgi:hypothetical protein
VGSRLGTHAIWTLTLSAAISLLALSPIVLPSGSPLERLPGPLAGIERVGKVVVGALARPTNEREPAAPAVEPERLSPPLQEAGTGVLAELAGGTRAQQPRERPARPHRPDGPSSPPRHETPRLLTRAELKAERRAGKVAAKAERTEVKSEQKEQNAEEKAERNDEKEHDHQRVGSPPGHGKKSDKARDKKGGGNS